MPRPAHATRPHRRRAALAALLVVGLALAACAAPKHQSSVPTAGPSASDDASLAQFYGQAPEWTTCSSGDDCARVTVPVDYADPTGETIELQLARHRATGGDPIGTLFINPGGPGASGVSFLSSFESIAGDDVLQQFDIVGFDPRGVGASAPVDCVDDSGLDELLSMDVDDSDEGLAAARATWAAFGAGCAERMGALVGHVDTISAARDLDVLRSAVGDETLSYLGFSYGTQLGATYAALFPQRVGRLVLDGALDPTLTSDELSRGQAAGFESALRAYATDCLASSTCPLSGTVDDALQQVADLLDRARVNPLPTGSSRELTGALAFTGVALPLYSQGSWTYLTSALRLALRNGDGSGLLALSDIYSDRNADGSYSTNAMEAFYAIGCLDGRSSPDLATMRSEAAKIQEVAPTVWRWFSYGGLTCADWPAAEVGPLDSYAAEGAPPILVIGTTNDPATPYAWAQSLASELSSGVLLTHVGEGHTAYGSSNECVLDTVDDFLTQGEVPDEGARC